MPLSQLMIVRQEVSSVASGLKPQRKRKKEMKKDLRSTKVLSSQKSDRKITSIGVGLLISLISGFFITPGMAEICQGGAPHADKELGTK
jgi:hypothetical protein